MADDIYQILGSVIDLWELPTRGDNEYVETTEFWLDRKKNTVKVSSRKIAPDERSAWFDERTQGEGDKTKSLLARFVWVEANAPEHHISLALSVQQHVVQKFGLTLAHHYFKSNLSGVNAFPRVAKSHADRRSYAFCFGPKRAAIWSQTVPKDATSEPFIEGIFFLQAMPKGRALADGMAGGTAAQFQKLIERAPWAPEVVRSSAFPAYLNALVLSKEITQTVAERSSQIRGIESRTGFHEYQGRGEPFESDEILHDVSARASGISTKLASVTRKAQMTEKLLDFIDQMVEEDHYHFESQRPDSQPPRGPGKHLLTKNVSVLKQRLEMQAAETAYALKRVQTQSTVLFNLISLAEAEQNTALSHSMKKIALTTQRDAASMKTLAYVTMFFLPGSFVSAIFSTPLFRWDDVDLTSSSIKVGTTPQFKLYWAVTVPLTVVTFICYFLWLWWQHQQRKNLNRKRGSTEPTLAERVAELEGETRKRMAERDIIRKRKNTVQSEEYGIPMTGVSSWRSTWRNTWGKDQHV